MFEPSTASIKSGRSMTASYDVRGFFDANGPVPLCCSEHCLTNHAHTQAHTEGDNMLDKVEFTYLLQTASNPGSSSRSPPVAGSWAPRPIHTCLCTWPTPFSTCAGLRHFTCSLQEPLCLVYSHRDVQLRRFVQLSLSTSCSHRLRVALKYVPSQGRKKVRPGEVSLQRRRWVCRLHAQPHPQVESKFPQGQENTVMPT